MNNQYSKFRYYGIKIIGGTDYTNQTPSKHFTENNSKFKTPKRTKIFMKVYIVGGAHLQCVNNHYAKYENKRMKTFGVTDYTNQTPPTHFRWNKCLKFNIHQKLKRYLSNMHKMEGAHLQCVNNHHAKFENKDMKTVGITDYANCRHNQSIFGPINV